MKKQTDLQLIESLTKKWNIPFNRFTEREMLLDDAVKIGGVVAIMWNGQLDLYFNKRGKYVGTCTCSVNSWKPRRKKAK